jgi:hypothetical protein
MHIIRSVPVVIDGKVKYDHLVSDHGRPVWYRALRVYPVQIKTSNHDHRSLPNKKERHEPSL